MYGQLDAIDSVDHLIVHIGREIRRLVGVFVAGTDLLVDEQAQMGVVDLHDGNPFVAQALDFPPQDGHAISYERFACGVGGGRLLAIPHAFAQQRRCRQGGLDLPLGDCLEESDFLSDEARVPRRKAVDHDRPRSTIAGIGTEFEPMSQFGDNADVRLAPPLAVAHHIQTG